MNKYLLAGIVALAILVGVVTVRILTAPTQVEGSVTVGNDYQATSTRNFAGTALPSLSLISGRSGALSRVTVTGTNVSVFRLWDATTTDVNKRTGNIASSSLNFVEIGTTATGTLDFDLDLKYGLIYEAISGTVATSTILFR